MFTGLIAGTGTLTALSRRGPGYRLQVRTAGLEGFDALALGESIAVNGACLTVVARTEAGFDADISSETAEKTTLGKLGLGSELNLERALRLGDRLGGHLVSGHVDAVAEIESVEEAGESWLVRVAFGEQQRRFLAPKGSVTLDGVSLTVNEVALQSLSVMLIPHTRSVTNLKHWRPGTQVNLELDLVARYLVSYLEATGQKPALTGPASFALALERAGYK